MAFLDSNEEVFALGGATAASGITQLRETRSKDARPVIVECQYLPQGDSTATVTLEWNSISAQRLNRGDRVDFTFFLERHGEAKRGDVLILRFPLDPGKIADPVFAAVGAVSYKTSQPADLLGVELGFAEQGELRFALPIAHSSIAHMASAWHFRDPRSAPALEIRFHLQATGKIVSVRCGRLFAGHGYDPYVFNPAMEKIAHFNGRPEIPGAAEAIAEFERRAIQAARSHSYEGMQCFIRPFAVMREGNPRFPMLIGTPNSISWYAIDPAHGCELYAREGYVAADDIVLDCGAHAGQMSTLFALEAGKRGRVVAFDPFPQNCFQIEAQAQLNRLDNLEAVMAGVGASREKVNASINGQQTLNAAAGQSGRLDIDILPLDEYADLGPTFMKVDVEGADVAAMLGAQKLMRKCRPKIFVELHTQFIGQFGHTLADFFQAIPRDIYNVVCRVEGVDHAWRHYEPGLENGVTQPMLVWATPR
jgi:FkbM family methyltransferase